MRHALATLRTDSKLIVSPLLAAVMGVIACINESPPKPSERFDAGVASADAALAQDASTAVDAGAAPRLIEIAIEPRDSLSVVISTTATVTARGIYAGGAEQDLSAAVEWHTSSATTATVDSRGGIRGHSEGTASVWATYEALQSDRLRVVVTPDPGEFRGVWVTRWTFATPNDIARIVDEVERAHLNAILLQVRAMGDAFYRSSLEPWSRNLSGTLGRDPGWDPLGEMVTRAHARGIEVHAWINTFPAWRAAEWPAESSPRHKLLEHPEWLCADANGVPMPLSAESPQFFSPANADVREHVARVVEDLASNYAVDGIHFDFVRYPGRGYCHDAASERAFALESAVRADLDWGDFQRERITLFLEDVRTRMARVRPQAAITVASWGIHRNEFGWTRISRGYDDYYQAAHEWARRGIIDALCPMTYWPLTTPRGARTDFATLAEDHVQAAREGRRHAFLGISADHDVDEILAQIRVSRESGARGFVFFELKALRPYLDRLADGPFRERVETPRMTWKN